MPYIIIDQTEEFKPAYFSKLDKAIDAIKSNGEILRENDIAVIKACLIAKRCVVGQYRRFYIYDITPNKMEINS